jgi:drug/metabolite transporter (DMT)-like permease
LHDKPAALPARDVAPPERRVWLGLALLLFSAAAFSFHNTLARLAYDEGVTPTTINAARTGAVLLMFVALLGARGDGPRVPRAAWPLFAITAVCYSIHNPLLLIAFQFIPVSLAVLIIYVFPILVTFLAAAIGQERLTVPALLSGIVAFAGVALVLEIGGVKLDWRGVALAAVSAVALAGNVVGAAQLNRYMKALAVPFALSVVGVLVFGMAMLADGGPSLPATARGWLVFTAATLASPAAIFAFYLALPMAGAPRSSLVLNIEPVITVLLAVWLLGESLSWIQGAGAALIIGAVAVAALARLRARRLSISRLT